MGMALALALPMSAWSLGPHELAVVYNRDSEASQRIAETYLAVRGVPRVNLVGVHVPGRAGHVPFEMSPEDFTSRIWGPVMETLARRGVRDRILAWAYATDIPLRVTATPPISILGLTFLRNRLPAAEDVKDGTYASPLFAGEGLMGRPGFAPQTFDVFREWLRDEMPLPAMALGVSGAHGNSESDILACLRRGVASDATHPDAQVIFVESDDVRSTCRAWQYPSAVNALRGLGLRARTTRTYPAGERDILGVMMGAATVDARRVGTFVPGAMAEHLTSFAGDFSHGYQTKLTAWIAAGATASAGAVVEPYSIAAKFPIARFYAFYASGCTMIESFYQSVRCPLQLAMVGDPLACPWQPRYGMMVKGVPEGAVRAAFSVEAEPIPMDHAVATHFARYEVFVDGRSVANALPARIDPVGLGDGVHELRVVAFRTGLVRSQIHGVKAFTVAMGEAR